MTAAYEIERPELEGDELSPAQAAALRLRLENQRLQREADERGEAGSNPTPSPEAAKTETPAVPVSYPARLPDGRIMYGDWLTLNDPYSRPDSPRNTKGDVAYKVAQRELALEREAALTGAPTIEQMLARPRDENGRFLDEDGKPIPTPIDLHNAAQLEREKETLAALPVWRSDGNGELLYPDLGEAAPENDPRESGVVREQQRRERARRAAFYNTQPRSQTRRTVTLDDQMRAAGLLPPKELSEAEQKRAQVLAAAREGTRQFSDQIFARPDPSANKAAQEAIDRAYARGDVFTARTLEFELQGGR